MDWVVSPYRAAQPRAISFLIVVDTKNLALYGGGIAHWFIPLLAAWVEHRTDERFLLLGPPFNEDFLPKSGNWEHVPLAWPLWLPRPFRHPYYDNLLFPRAVAGLQPNLVMSPYHDVRMPKGLPSVITVHDLCLDELSGVYPQRIRSYYLALLRINLNRASHVITVSDTSKNKLAKRYSVPLNQVSVVYNTVSNYFTNSTSAQAVLAFKSRFTLQGRFLLYSGGSEYRKNVERLVKAFGVLVEKQPDLTLLVTGNPDPRWNAALENTSPLAQSRVKFAGKLSESDLCLAYSAADTVVYPSLCEGFGRVCLEAMEAGTPIACSDLPVMREVAGDYACWFDPFDNLSIVAAIEKALAEKRKEVVRDERFQAQAVKASFLDAMDRVTSQN